MLCGSAMQEPPRTPPTARPELHPWNGVAPVPGPDDEAIAYVAPDRMALPRQTMLFTLLGLLVVVLVGGALATAFLLLGDPFGPGHAGSAQRSYASLTNAEIRRLPPPPPVEPVHYLDVPQETARKVNEAVPFSTEPNPAAIPLRLNLAPADRARAVDCLAAAAWYEAGDDTLGQESVIQTVINRMRHPSFPNSVCGVVFQGSERKTGCQFTFTCDGALVRRTPSATAWGRAQAMASLALNGLVFSPIGWATHYHTDWVVPNWSSSVDKVAKIRTHLFFRWRGASGRPVAFHRAHAGSEPVLAAMRGLSPSHAGTLALEPLPSDISADVAGTTGGDAKPLPSSSVNADLRGNALTAADSSTGLFVIQIKSGTFPGALAVMALDICKGRRESCTVVGFAGTPGRVTGGAFGRVRWPDKVPDFYYFSDKSRSREIAYWNCATFPRPDGSQCLPPNYQPAG